MVSYVTGFPRLTSQRTECKHLLFDKAWIVLQDRISEEFPWGEQNHSQRSVFSGLHILVTLCTFITCFTKIVK